MHLKTLRQLSPSMLGCTFQWLPDQDLAEYLYLSELLENPIFYDLQVHLTAHLAHLILQLQETDREYFHTYLASQMECALVMKDLCVKQKGLTMCHLL